MVGTDCDIGYLHRGVEKLAEHREYFQALTLTDRMDYIAAVSNNLGYVETVEKLLDVTAPPRTQYIRTLLTELNRIASHLLWLATHALDIGAMWPQLPRRHLPVGKPAEYPPGSDTRLR